MDKECQECGRTFFGRADKKFCTDACRSSYNNRIRAITSPLIPFINKILKKNWEILNEFLDGETQRVPTSKIIKRGFDFEFVTQVYTTKDGKEYRFCYDLGYLSLSEQYLLLVRRKDNL